MSAHPAPSSTEERKAALRRLLAAMESAPPAEAERLFEQFVCAQEGSLFRRLGELTRDLHEAIQAFLQDNRIAALAQEGMPDARQRLHHVIAMTEQAAHRVLEAVEAGLPAAERAGRRLERTRRELARMARRLAEEGGRQEEAPALLARAGRRLERAGADLALVRGCLSEVMLAQGFQDLTSQIIRPVIQLVEEVERSLVRLVRLGGGVAEAPAEGASRAEAATAPAGPALPGEEGRVQGQDDVDELLSSLGF